MDTRQIKSLIGYTKEVKTAKNEELENAITNCDFEIAGVHGYLEKTLELYKRSNDERFGRAAYELMTTEATLKVMRKLAVDELEKRGCVIND